MQLFYIENRGQTVRQCHLSAEESRHCITVLRKKKGDNLYLTDGVGGFYTSEIVEANARKCVYRVLKKENRLPRPHRLHIAIALPKNAVRFEWFIEKATEIGIEIITPLLCQRSEKRRMNINRMNKICVTAMKQSLKMFLPHLREPMAYSDFMKQIPANHSPGNRFIATCVTGPLPHLKDAYQRGENATILIGPEGDFSEPEIALAVANGFAPIGLGNSRLRLETAGIAACYAVAMMNE